MSKQLPTPPLLKTRTRDPLESSWRTHMGEGQWVPDVSVSTCMLCRAEFSWWIRRHHCRRCGAVVCDSCSLSRTKFIYKEITPTKTAAEDCRVCDLCIQVIDEKLAEGLSKRFGKSIPTDTNENDDNSNTPEPAPLPASKTASRTVLTVGRYRAEIKESEGNRYIRDTDL